jgi:DNA-binding PadR family transcriptional regulator
LRKLEKRGLLSARWGDEAPEERGGPRRRYYTTTGLGETARQAALERRRLLETGEGLTLAPEES